MDHDRTHDPPPRTSPRPPSLAINQSSLTLSQHVLSRFRRRAPTYDHAYRHTRGRGEHLDAFVRRGSQHLGGMIGKQPSAAEQQAYQALDRGLQPFPAGRDRPENHPPARAQGGAYPVQSPRRHVGGQEQHRNPSQVVAALVGQVLHRLRAQLDPFLQPGVGNIAPGQRQ